MAHYDIIYHRAPEHHIVYNIVGHMTMGAGMIKEQGPTQIQKLILSGEGMKMLLSTFSTTETGEDFIN